MNIPAVSSYGSWSSPITSEMIVSKAIGLGQVVLDGRDIYWVEQRPMENGRNVIVRCSPDLQITDITPSPFSVRTRVHEYGGGAYIVDQGVIYFSNFADQRLYRQEPGNKPHPITAEGEMRYADGIVDKPRNRIICVGEDHAVREEINSLISVSLDGSGQIQQLVKGNDFYAAPRISPDGSHLIWLTWNHPNMPWDSTELWSGEITSGGDIANPVKIAGGLDESIGQPEFSSDGTLYFVSDRTGWWNLYRWKDNQTELMCGMEAEFGVPQWSFGRTKYAFESTSRIICSYIVKGISYLARLDLKTRKLETFDTPYTYIESVKAAPDYLVAIAGSPTESTSVVRLRPDNGQAEVLRRSNEIVVDKGYVSMPEAIEFPTENGLTAHAFFYPPRNRDYTAPSGELPPLIVFSHGGPTGATSNDFHLSTQFWTSRGLAVVDVNYGGSTGYGRAYRERLNGQWGVVDVDDCINAARYLVRQGAVDPKRIAIRGGSAGGYTTLCALTFRNFFKVGASYYGVGDLEALDKDCHKFESRYNVSMIGPYPECRDLYMSRSPIHFVEKLSCPVIFFQGTEDKIVPPNQSEMMVEALRRRGLPVAYLLFEHEQHGFRIAANIKRSLEAELYFYSRILGFTTADKIEPVEIENLK